MAQTPDVTYRASDHTYWNGTTQIPGVNEIIADQGLVDPRWYTPESRRRGQAVAIATHRFDQGTLNVAAAEREGIIGHIEGWAAFVDDLKVELVAREKLIVGPNGTYAGRLDGVGIIQRRATLLEIKTGQYAKWHKLQTAGYADGWGLPAYGTNRVVIYLSPRGYKPVWHSDQSDRAAWRSAVALYHWKRR